jgi:hypothetical protein
VLDQILEEVNFTPEDLDEYIAKFSEVSSLDPATFYVKEKTDTAAAQPKITHQESTPVSEEKKIVKENKVREATVNERLNNSKQPAVMDSLRRIAKIKDSLTINQKFMFTKVLFYGDFESFSRAIDDLDQLPDMNVALEYLEKHSSSWDRESKEFHEFMELVEKRFS